MKKTRRAGLKLAALATTSMLLLAACSPNSASGDGDSASTGALEDMEPVTMTIPDVDPESGVVGQAWLEFADTVEEKSGGKITVETYLSDSLMPYDEALGALRDGTVQMARLIPNAHPEELPVLNWYMKFGSVSSNSFPQGWLQSAGMTNEVHTQVPAFREEVESHNVIPLAATSTSQEYNLLCNTPVDSPKDLKGMRVRAGGEPWTGEVQSLGMSPVSLLSPEAYEGLQRGTIECGSADPYQFMAYGWVEVGDQYIPVHQTTALNNVYVVNRDFWESLPEDAQDIIDDATEQLWLSVVQGYTAAYGDFATEIEERGINVVDATEINEILEAHKAEVGAQLPELAPASIEDPEAVVEEIQKIGDEWLDSIVEESGLELKERDADNLIQEFQDAGDMNLDFMEKIAQERGNFSDTE